MDKIIEKKKWTPKKIIGIAIVATFIVVVFYNIIFGDKSSKLNVQLERIAIEEVREDFFRDYISTPSTVFPIRTIYLDALEGGRVEEIYLEEGNHVEAGDEILRLSNTNLHLNIMTREANLAEQMNNLRNTRLLMEQNKLDLRSQILELDYLIDKSEEDFEDKKALFEKDFISDEEFNDVKMEYDYLLQRKELVIESQKQDSLFREIQIEQLEQSVSRMQDNLDLVRKKLDNLTIKAPVSGELAFINAEIGESKGAGQRLGQINVLDSYKLQADIDEYYINRIVKGLKGQFEFAGQEYSLIVNKVYTVVQNGRFSVDLTFTSELPPRIRTGQTFRVKLELGAPKEAILIPKGGFYQTTGGQWIFVIDESGDFAYKREITLGSMNPRFYEVLDGLMPGERVIISGYDNFGDADKLMLKE